MRCGVEVPCVARRKARADLLVAAPTRARAAGERSDAHALAFGLDEVQVVARTVRFDVAPPGLTRRQHLRRGIGERLEEKADVAEVADELARGNGGGGERVQAGTVSSRSSRAAASNAVSSAARIAMVAACGS